MKYIFPLLTLLLAERAAAQTHDDGYWMVSTGFGTLFTPLSAKQVSVQYPYTVNDTGHIFNGGLPGAYGRHMYTFETPAIEYVRKQHAFDLAIGWNSNLARDYSVYLRTGYKRVFSLDRFQIKPGFDLFALFGYNETMGNIDNRNTDVYILGSDAAASWMVESTDDDGNTTVTTYYADHLDVDYKRRSLNIVPNVTVSFNPAGKLYLNIVGGYFIECIQSNQINLVQVDQYGNSHTAGRNHTTANGSFNGPYVAFGIGVGLWNEPSRLRSGARRSLQ